MGEEYISTSRFSYLVSMREHYPHLFIIYATMLLTTLLLPLAVSAAVLQQRDTAAVTIETDKLTPRYRKTANRIRYRVGRKYGIIDIEALLTFYSIHA